MARALVRCVLPAAESPEPGPAATEIDVCATGVQFAEFQNQMLKSI